MSLIKLTGSIIEANTITTNNLADGAVTQNLLAEGLSLSGIRISGITYPGDDTAANTAGGQSIVLTGAGFESGAAVLVDYVSVGSVTVTNSTSISFTAPAKSAGGYLVHVVNADGATAIHVPGIQYSGTPTWSTPAASVGTFYETTAVSNTVTATSDSLVQYEVVSGSLPTGASMNANGVITGTSPLEDSSTTFTFTVRATDNENQSTDRTFTITIDPDVVTWSAPANNSTITTYEYVPITNTFVATSAAGQSVTYSANVLPANVSISGDTVSGTPTTVGNTTSLITATADVTGKVSTEVLNFVVQEDVVTWSSPANNTTVNIPQNVANTIGLSATGAAGFDVSYSANVLPTGMSVSGNTITGTPTVVGNTTSLITATAAATNRTATRVLNWVIQVAADSYWRDTIMLLSANASVLPATFTIDNSVNAAQLTAVGDTRASNLNPYQYGYYSNQFNGANTYQTIPYHPKFDFAAGVPMCFEGWIHPQSFSTSFVIASRNWNFGGSGPTWGFIVTSATAIEWSIAGSGVATYVLTRNQSLASPYTIPLNKWTHVAFTRDSSNVCRIFVNGYLVASQTYTSALSSASGDIYLGVPASGSAQSSGWANGLMSNLRLVNGSIPTDYATSNTTVGTRIFTPPTSPLTNTSNTVLLVCNSNGYRDTSPMSQSVSSFGGGATVVGAHPFTAAYQSNNSQQYSYYNNGTTYALGTVANSITIGTSDFCLEGWGHWTSFNNGTYGAPVISLMGDTAGELMIRATKTSANTTTANWFNIVGGSTYIPSAMYTSGVSGGTLYLNRWHHLAVSRKSGTWSFFLDGVRVSSTSAGDASLTLPFNKAYIGSDGAGGGGYMTGQTSNVRLVVGDSVYDGATYTVPTSPLTAITGTKLLTAQDATFKDNSGYSSYTFTQGTANTRPVAVSPFTPPSYSNTQVTTFGSAYFDGTGDYISMPNQTGCQLGTGDFTVEFWWYLTSTFSSVEGPGIGQKAGDSYNGWVIYRNHGSNTDKMTIRIGSSNSDYSTTVVPKTGMWQHWAVVRNGTTLTWYCDGVACGTYTGVTGNATDTSGLMYIGYSQTWNYVVGSGYMADVRVTKSAVYTSNFVPQFTGPLPALANTQLLTLQGNSNRNNNAFKDSSVFDNIVTRVNNVTPGSFSPYGDNWSTYFNGSTDYISTPSGFNTIFPGLAGRKIQIEAWVRPTLATRSYAMGVIGTYAAVSANGRWYFGIDTDNTLLFVYTTGTGSQNNIKTTGYTIPVDQWSHIAVTVDATTASAATIKFYINGVEVFVSTNNNMSTQTSNYGAPTISINSSYMTMYKGFMSNVRVTKNAFTITGSFSVPSSPHTATSNTVLLACQSNRIIDASQNALALTLSGTPVVQKFSPVSTISVPKYYSTKFNGSSDYLSTSPSITLGTSNWTVEGWFYLAGLPASGQQAIIFATPWGGNNIQLYVNESSQLQWQAYTNNGSTYEVTVGKWTHFAISNSSSTVKLFIDGVLKETVGGYNIDSQGTVTIGGRGASLYFNGCISNIRIVTGVGMYSADFTPSTTPLTAIANTVLLTCQDASFIDNSSTARTVTAGTVTVNPIPVSPFTPTASDVAAYSVGAFGGSIYYDGVDDYLTLPSGTQYNLVGDFTIEAWVYPTAALGNAWSIFDARVNGATASPWSIGLAASSGYKLDLWTGTSYRGTKTINLNEWTHVVWTRNGSTLRSYVNGIVDYNNASFGTGDISPGTTTPWVGSKDNGLAGYETQGYISDFRITKGACLYPNNFYPGSIPATPIPTVGANTYNSLVVLNGASGGIMDVTRSGNLQTFGEVKVTSFSPYQGGGRSYYFDGNGDYLTTAVGRSDLDLTQSDFTLECWIYNTGAGAERYLFSQRGSGTGWEFRINSTNLCQFFYTSGSSLTAATAIAANTWTHLAVVRSGTNVKIYINGTQDASGTFSNGSDASASYGMYIGYGTTGGGYMSGYMSDVRITKVARNITTPTEPYMVK